MPRYNPSDEEMDEYYESPKSKPNNSKGGEKPAQKEPEEAQGTTTVVPLSVLQSSDKEPVKEGDEIVVRVLQVMADEAEIEYAPKEKPHRGGKGMMDEADEELDSISEKEGY